MAQAKLDLATTRRIMNLLRDNGLHEAALDLAELYMKEQYTPQDYLEENEDLDDNGHFVNSKIRVIKNLRSEFGLVLKEAKAEADKYQGRL